MERRRLASVVTLAAAFGLAISGCGGNGGDGGNSGDDPSAAPGRVISVGISEPRHLLPPNTTESSGAQVLAALFSPLISFDGENKPVENVAESVTTTDSKVWNIKIKDGWTFHNGEKVTSDSFIDAWNYGAYGPNGQGGNYFYTRIQGYDDMNTKDPDGDDGAQKAPKPKADKLTGLTKTDDLNFTVTLKEPFADWKSVMGYTVFYPMPKAAFTDLEAYEQAPIGNGPFKMKGKWEHDKQVEVETFDKYAGQEKPKVPGVRFPIYQEPATEYRDLVTSNHDVMKQIPTAELSNAPSDLGERFAESSSSSYQFLAFPTYDERFKKPEVRKAISMAIDRDAIVKTIFQGSQDTARSFVSPVVPGFRDNTCGDACKFDPAAAKALLQQAGGIPGNKLTITYNADGDHKPWTDAVCNQLQENLGVPCTTAAEPAFADLLEKVDANKAVGMFRMAWLFDYPSMENYLGPLYACEGSSNYYGYCNEEFDKLVADGSKAATPEEAIKIWQQAEDILVRDLPVLPMRFGKNSFGWSENVKDVEIDAFQRVNLLKIAPAS